MSEESKLEVVQACINVLRHQWYELNSVEPDGTETPRDIGIRVGRKMELVSSINRLRAHFKLED